MTWTNDPDVCFCKVCDDAILKNESHHKAIVIEIEFNDDVKSNANKEYYKDFANANYDDINNEIASVDWCSILNNSNSLQFKTDQFYNIINNIINNHVQIKEQKKSNHPLWYDKLAINLKNRINRLHKKMKFPHSRKLIVTYKNLKKFYTDYIRQLYSNYKIEIQDKIDDDPTQFYSHVKQMRKQTDDLPRSMTFKNQCTDDKNEIAEYFRLFFQSVYSNPNENCIQNFNEYSAENDHLHKLRGVCINIPVIDLKDDHIVQKISDLPDNMICGPDNIPNRFIKRCIKSIAKPISMLLKESLNTSAIPYQWKQSFIRPIHKCGKSHKSKIIEVLRFNV